MKNKSGLVIIDHYDKRVIYSEWSKYEYIFFNKDIEKNIILEYTIGMRYEKIRADGKLIARGIIFIT